MNNNRILKQKIDLETEKISDFFEQRSKVSSDKNIYVSVTYQDKKPEIAVLRDKYEKQLILPQLKLLSNSNVLDIGCGIGRWADVVVDKVKHYVGIDFSEALILQAKERFSANKEVLEFKVLAAQDVCIGTLGYNSYFDKVILSGVLLYLNDRDIIKCFQNLVPLLSKKVVLYIREPMSKGERLTLNGVWSEDMQQEYFAIYRNRDELRHLICSGLGLDLPVKFKPLYEDPNLNNRKETMQFYDVLEVGF